MAVTSARPFRAGLLLALTSAGVLSGVGLFWDRWQPAVQASDRRGDIEEQVKSNYSTIRIRRANDHRSLCFVRDSGEEVTESMLDLRRPYDLLIDYTRYMFLSYVFCPKPERVLIVGLGGGSMVHFLRRYDKDVKVDVAEIDPEIVRLADKYFGVRTGGNVKIINTDAFEYLMHPTEHAYDVIYLDAFLKPSVETDSTGVLLRLKTIQFYKEMQKRLKPDGIAVFNINPHQSVDEDIARIRVAFPQTYVFHLPNYGGQVVVASLAKERMEPKDVVAAAQEIDRRFAASYSFRRMAASSLSP
jgi:spermidine synthase